MQLEALLQLLSNQKISKEPDEPAQATMAQTGNRSYDWNSWIVDSGASDHMTYNKTLFCNYESFPVPKPVTIANGVPVHAHGQGTIYLTSTLTLHNVLFVPKLNFNLISVGNLMFDNNCLTLFSL